MNLLSNISQKALSGAILSVIGFYIAYVVYSLFVCLFGCTVYLMHDQSWKYLSDIIVALFYHDCVPILSDTCQLILLSYIVVIFLLLTKTIKQPLKEWKASLSAILATLFPVMLISAHLIWNEDVLTSPTGFGGADRGLEVFNAIQALLYNNYSQITDGWKYATLLLIPSGLSLIVITQHAFLSRKTALRLIKISFYGFLILQLPDLCVSLILGSATTSFKPILFLRYSILTTLYMLFRYGIYLIPYTTLILTSISMSGGHRWLIKHNVKAIFISAVIMLIMMSIIMYMSFNSYN